MAKLAIRLLKAGANQVRIVHPPADVPDGWDLADADWSVGAAAAYLKHNRSAPIELPELAPEPEPEPAIEPDPLPDGNDYFTCLGFDHDALLCRSSSRHGCQALIFWIAILLDAEDSSQDLLLVFWS
jgi:hypothetical protein